MAISREEFDYVRTMVHAHSGLVLEPGKEYLVESRLMPLAQSEGLNSVQALVERLRSSSLNGLHQRVVEAMTTNETSFFRDLHPFEELRKSILPRLIEKRRLERQITIWSAACSTGQEPYTIAMTLQEHFPELAGWTCRLMASDISGEVIAKARSGRYTQLEVSRGLPAAYLVKHFSQQGNHWVIGEELRRKVEYFAINLTKPWPALPRIDIILMRNVLIYLDLDTKKRIFANLRRQLQADGYLVLGGAETTLGIDDSFERISSDKGGGWFRLREA